MDEKQKKQINDAIAVIRSVCANRDYCTDCPFAYNCGIAERYCGCPWAWKDIE